MADTHVPDAQTIVLVQDNLNTHKPASLCEAFPASAARRLVERYEWHSTPKHGSWPDMAESELGVLTSQCLDRRIANKSTLTPRSRSLGAPSKRPAHPDKLALRNRERPHQLKRVNPRFE